jgi:periplasmic copper chaperone A
VNRQPSSETTSRRRTQPDGRRVSGPIARVVLGAAVVTGFVMGASTGAHAHIDPDPGEVPAGATSRVTLLIEHGCGTSPTVEIDLQIPEGFDITPVLAPGWEEIATDSDVVTVVMPPQPANVAVPFVVDITTPPTPGVAVPLKFVQLCTEGVERWIGETDTDNPAPILRLGAVAVPGEPAETVPPTPIDDTTAPSAPTTGVATPPTPTVPTSAAPSLSAPSSPQPTTVAAEGDNTPGDTDQSRGPWLLIGGGAIALVGAGVWVVRSRRT